MIILQNIICSKCLAREFAQSELLESEGVDLKLEMESKMKEIEEQWRREKEEATQAFQQERKKFEDQIETLQKQVMEQSMTMSMMSSVTPDDFNHDDDLYGKDKAILKENVVLKIASFLNMTAAVFKELYFLCWFLK